MNKIARIINKLTNQMTEHLSSRNNEYILLGTPSLCPPSLSLIFNTGFRNRRSNLKYWNPSVKSIQLLLCSVLKWVASSIDCTMTTIDLIGSIDLSVLWRSIIVCRIYWVRLRRRLTGSTTQTSTKNTKIPTNLMLARLLTVKTGSHSPVFLFKM